MTSTGERNASGTTTREVKKKEGKDFNEQRYLRFPSVTFTDFSLSLSMKENVLLEKKRTPPVTFFANRFLTQ